MKNSVKFSAKTALEKPLREGDEVAFRVEGIVSRIYHKPKDDETVYVVRIFQSFIIR